MLVTLKRQFRASRENCLFIGVDKDFVFDGSTKYPLVDYCLSVAPQSEFFVCTRKEASLLLNTMVLPGVKIQILEISLPFLVDVKYLSDCRQNFKQLRRLVKKFQSFVPMGFFGTLQNKYHQKLLKKIPQKEELDKFFMNAPHSSLQEAYIFKELRKNRTILAFDFNSMFGWGLLGAFSNPLTLKYKVINKELKDIPELSLGTYKVEFQGADDFIKKFFPFTVSKIGKSYYFNLNERESWIGWLTVDELKFYSKHFRRIFVYEGVISKEEIKYPFASICRRLYKQRNHFKSQSNKTYSTLCKLEIACLHAISVPTIRTIKVIENISDLKNLLRSKTGFCVDENIELFSQLSSYINFKNNFRFRFYNPEVSKERIWEKNSINKLCVSLKEHNEGSSIYCLFSEVLGHVRTRLLETIEYIFSFQGAEICYANIDSIHVSLPVDLKDQFLEYMLPLIGQDMGMLKIEAEASEGVWLSPGIYCLKNDGKVIMEKIKGISSRWHPVTVSSQRVYTNSVRTSGLTLPVYSKISLEKVIGLKNELEQLNSRDFVRFNRFALNEINNPLVLKNKLKKIRDVDVPFLIKEWEEFHIS